MRLRSLSQRAVPFGFVAASLATYRGALVEENVLAQAGECSVSSSTSTGDSQIPAICL